MVGLTAWGPMLAEAMHSVKTGEPSFRRSTGVEFFEYLTAHPRDGELFNEAMTAFGRGVVADMVQPTISAAPNGSLTWAADTARSSARSCKPIPTRRELFSICLE